MIATTPRMICVTGGIGAGKSVVAATLRLKGFKVYDCDSRAKQMMQSDPTLRKSLTEILGDGIYDADGHLRRKETAERLSLLTAHVWQSMPWYTKQCAAT